MAHHVIRPVERDCICAGRRDQAHTPQCDDSFRDKFFGAWTGERTRFYSREFMRADTDRYGPEPLCGES